MLIAGRDWAQMHKLDDLNLTPARVQRIVLLLLLTFFILLGILSSPGITVTLDEPLHYHYGLFVLQGKTDRIDDSSMPVLALNALPQYIATLLPEGAAKSILQRYFIARLVTILFSAAVAGLVFRWARSLYGFVSALFATVLYILDPNIIAHSQLVTTDIYAMGMIALTFFLLWKFANTRRPIDGLICACALGLSQLAKYTAVALFPLGLLALLLHDLPSIRDAYRRAGRVAIGRYLRELATYVAVALIITALVINIGFLFNRTFTPLKDYQFQSGPFRSLQANLPSLGSLPVPVPYPYLQGLDWMLRTDQAADRFGNIYLLGHVSKPRGFLGYYFVASALKVPIATQLLVVAGLIVYFLSPARRARFFRNEVFFFVPVVFFTIYFNFFFNAQTGIRYYLVIFPLLYVFIGHLFADWKSVPVAAKASSIALLVFLAISVLSYFPWFIPYFNEFVWDKTQTYKYLSDSNLDWDQSTGELNRFLAAHPAAIYDPPSVESGLLVVGGSDLVGIRTKPEQYAWLRDNFKPVDTIAYSYFVYRISPQETAKLCASTAYCR